MQEEHEIYKKNMNEEKVEKKLREVFHILTKQNKYRKKSNLEKFGKDVYSYFIFKKDLSKDETQEIFTVLFARDVYNKYFEKNDQGIRMSSEWIFNELITEDKIDLEKFKKCAKQFLLGNTFLER